MVGGSHLFHWPGECRPRACIRLQAFSPFFQIALNIQQFRLALHCQKMLIWLSTMHLLNRQVGPNGISKLRRPKLPRATAHHELISFDMMRGVPDLLKDNFSVSFIKHDIFIKFHHLPG